jgi:hypothetical protein
MAISSETEISRSDIMPKPRKVQVSLETTPYYHCVSRCVRRAFLCGVDTHTSKSYEHRREWIVDRIKALVEIFAIDTCAYSVMSNHYHIIVHVDTERAVGWSDQDVIERWERLFTLPVIVQRYRSMEVLSSAERDVVSEQKRVTSPAACSRLLETHAKRCPKAYRFD